MNLIEYCKKSPLYSPFKKIVLYRGCANPKILFVGEAPGKDEDIEGIPFIGRSGKLLNSWIDTFKIKELIGITNSVPLIPLTRSGSIRPPDLAEINYFRPFLRYMLDRYKPKLVVLLGNTACTSLLGLGVGSVRGKLIQKGKYVVTAFYHPAYYLRQGNNGLSDFNDMYTNVIKQMFTGLKTPNYEGGLLL
jgi:DNA polymerase